jgi:hypothetical protein
VLGPERPGRMLGIAVQPPVGRDTREVDSRCDRGRSASADREPRGREATVRSRAYPELRSIWVPPDGSGDRGTSGHQRRGGLSTDVRSALRADRDNRSTRGGVASTCWRPLHTKDSGISAYFSEAPRPTRIHRPSSSTAVRGVLLAILQLAVAAHRYADEPRRTSHRQAESDPRSVPRKADGLARHYRERATGELPTARFERRLSDRHPQAAGQRWAASLPPIPKGVVADAISSSTTGHHAASMWCSYSSTAVSREACARDRPRWRTRVRCTSGGAPPARAEARGDDQHRTEPA